MKQRDDGAERGTPLGGALGGVGSLPSSRLRSLVRRELQAVSAATAAAAAPQTGPNGELYRNFGDGFTRAFELAVTPVLFGFLGYGLDRWVGIVPVFTILFVLAAVIALLLRTWFGYVHRMQALEQAGPWARRP